MDNHEPYVLPVRDIVGNKYKIPWETIDKLQPSYTGILDAKTGLVTLTKLPTTEDWIKHWLSSFNTESATCCFTAVQQLKEKLNGQMD